MKKKKSLLVLIVQLLAAAGICLLLGFGVDNLRTVEPEKQSRKIIIVGSVFGKSSPYALPVLIFIILAAFFVALYWKKNKNK